MYDYKWNQKFDKKLNIPSFTQRYLNIINSNKKNIIIVKNVFDQTTFSTNLKNNVSMLENQLESLYSFARNGYIPYSLRYLGISNVISNIRNVKYNVSYYKNWIIRFNNYFDQYTNSINMRLNYFDNYKKLIEEDSLVK